MKTSKIILNAVLWLLVVGVVLAGVSYLSYDWRARHGLTVAAYLKTQTDEDVKLLNELDSKLKQANDAQVKTYDLLVKRQNEANEKRLELARRLGSFDDEERALLAKELQQGELSERFRARPDVAEALLLYQSALSLQKDLDALSAQYERFQYEIARTRARRDDVERQIENRAVLGDVENDGATQNANDELVESLTALGEEAERSLQQPLEPDDVNSSKAADELLSAVLTASSENNYESAKIVDKFEKPERLEESRDSKGPNELVRGFVKKIGPVGTFAWAATILLLGTLLVLGWRSLLRLAVAPSERAPEAMPRAPTNYSGAPYVPAAEPFNWRLVTLLLSAFLGLLCAGPVGLILGLLFGVLVYNCRFVLGILGVVGCVALLIFGTFLVFALLVIGLAIFFMVA